jgi:hypothetical protein
MDAEDTRRSRFTSIVDVGAKIEVGAGVEGRAVVVGERSAVGLARLPGVEVGS